MKQITSVLILIVLIFASCNPNKKNTNKMEEQKTKIDNNRVTILIEIHAKKGQEDFTQKTFTETITTSHKPGMISSIVYADKNQPGVFYSVQEWENIEAFQQHMKDAKASEEKFAEVTSMLSEAPKTSVLKRIN